MNITIRIIDSDFELCTTHTDWELAHEQLYKMEKYVTNRKKAEDVLLKDNEEEK